MKEEGQSTRIAIVSPAQNAYSESFIQAHKHGLDDVVAYYYGGHVPKFLEGKGALKRSGLDLRIKRRFSFPEWGTDADDFAHSLREQKIDVVLAEYGPTGAQIAPVCQALGIPLVIHFHGYDASKHAIIEKYSDRYRQAFEQAAAVIVVSQAMYDMVLSLGASPDKLLLNHYGPDVRFAGLDTRPPQFQGFLSIGRFVDKKAPYYTILAFAKLIELGYDTTLTMAGDGPLLPTCKNLARTLGVEDKVSFLGATDRETVIELVRTRSCFVQHSIRAEDGDMEGTPLAVLETGIAAMPIVSTYHAGIPDVISSADYGFLVPEHDVTGMTASMKSVLDDYPTALMKGAALSKRIKEQFSMKRNLTVLQEVMDRTSIQASVS